MSKKYILFFLSAAAVLIFLSAFLNALPYTLNANVASAQSFLGPGSQSAGTGQGAVGVDSSYNLAVGTSTTQADTKLLIVGTSTTGAAGSGYFAIKVLDAQRGPLFIVRGDGSVSIGSPYIQTNQSSATGTISGVNPNAPANGALFVHGPIFSTLDIKADGGISVGTTTPQTGGTIYAAGGISTGGALTATTYSGTVSAGNISAGNFGANTGGGNYTFPASVSIGSSTAPTGGVLFVNGNVGIGTAGPGKKLDVAGTLGVSDTITSTKDGLFFVRNAASTGVQYMDIANTGGRAILGVANSAGTSPLTNSTAYAVVLNSDFGTPIQFAVGGSAPAMSIISGDNVGIGTTGPTARLTVARGSGSYSTGVTNYVMEIVDANNNGNGLGIFASDGTTTKQVFALSYNNVAAGQKKGVFSINDDGTQEIRFDTNGNSYINTGSNVGIGTTNPTSTLTVAGAIKSTTGGFIFPDGTTQTTAGGGGSQWTTSSTAIYYTTGNVGIGNTNPQAKLDITGDNNQLRISTAGTYSSIYFYNGAANSAAMYTNGTATNIENRGSGALYLGGATSQTHVTILNGGNVGIGQAVPGYKLDVSGTGNFTQPVFVGTPTNAGHAATRSYVDNALTAGTTVVSFATTTISTLGGNLNANGYNITAVNKLTVTTIDPVYSIGGVKYATYGADTIGLKTEVYGKAALSSSKSSSYVIDFAAAKPGSDLWLFWQTIDEGKNMKDIVVNLTPEFNGRAWYELEPAKKQIVIHAESSIENCKLKIGNCSLEVSYHLVAPRHDAAQWSNFAPDAEEKGTVLKIK